MNFLTNPPKPVYGKRWSYCLSWFVLFNLSYGTSSGMGLNFRETQSEEMVRDVKETLKQVREILEKIEKENSNSGQRIKCMAPANPEFMVGMEQLVARLKMELLKDGVSTLGLTGLPGSGKTTLASALCWDPQVKGNPTFFFFLFNPLLIGHCYGPVGLFLSTSFWAGPNVYSSFI